MSEAQESVGREGNEGAMDNNAWWLLWLWFRVLLLRCFAGLAMGTRPRMGIFWKVGKKGRKEQKGGTTRLKGRAVGN